MEDGFPFRSGFGGKGEERFLLFFLPLAHTQNWSSISSVSSLFLSKTTLSDRGADILMSIMIPALGNLVSSELPDDICLRPVRAIRCYLQHTRTLRNSLQILFISHLEHVRRDISPVSISRWMVKTILFCYKKGGGFVDLFGQGLFRPGGGYLPSLFQSGFTRPDSKGRDLGPPLTPSFLST